MKLRSGFTTGACATATSLAAAQRLLLQIASKKVQIILPRGQQPFFEIHYCRLIASETAVAATIKDAGDDPDVTHGAEIMSQVTLCDQPGIQFKAGQGVGTVTRAGMPLAVGEAAINPVPRQMIEQHLSNLATQCGYKKGFIVTISITNGEKLAKKTMNERLGIVGGLSILGTTGIVRPFSCSAYIASIQQGIDVAEANGITHIAACTGNTSEVAVQQHYALPDMALIEMGDYVGAVVKHLKKKRIERLTIAGGFAKLSKLAEGHMNLHSKHSQVNFEFLAQLVRAYEHPEAMMDKIQSANTSAEVLSLCLANKIPIADRICESVVAQLTKKIPQNIALDVLVVSKSTMIVGRAGSLF